MRAPHANEGSFFKKLISTPPMYFSFSLADPFSEADSWEDISHEKSSSRTSRSLSDSWALSRLKLSFYIIRITKKWSRCILGPFLTIRCEIFVLRLIGRIAHDVEGRSVRFRRIEEYSLNPTRELGCGGETERRIPIFQLWNFDIRERGYLLLRHGRLFYKFFKSNSMLDSHCEISNNKVWTENCRNLPLKNGPPTFFALASRDLAKWKSLCWAKALLFSRLSWRTATLPPFPQVRSFHLFPFFPPDFSFLIFRVSFPSGS